MVSNSGVAGTVCFAQMGRSGSSASSRHDQDAVLAITSGDRNMQAILNLIWEKLLPAMEPAPLPANSTASRNLTRKLASLSVRPPSGRFISPLAASFSGKTYVFQANDRNIEAVTLDFNSDGTTLTIRTTTSENRIACGIGNWQKGRSSFVNGIDQRIVASKEHPVAACGAWTDDDTYALKLCLYETPICVTLIFRFKGNRLLFDSEYNVAFGPTSLPQLVGQNL